MNSPLSKAAAVYNELRERLKAEYALEDGEDALIDTLDGISDLKEMVAAAARQARYEKAMADGCKSIIANIQERKKRREEKAYRLRAAIAHAMQEAGEKKIDAPDMTISVRNGTEKLIIDGDPARGPDCFVIETVTRTWNIDAIAAARESFDEEALSISHWSNPEPVLTLRSK